MQTALAFIAALGLLVVVHELGHYAVARWCGVKVLRFSFGFGPVVWSRTFGRDGTEWAVSLVPLGGYVSMLGEHTANDVEIAPEDLPRAFDRQPVFKRIAIVLAGPVANLVLAVALYAGLDVAGVEEPVARLAQPTLDTPAAALGIREGDRVIAIDNDAVRSWVDLRWQMLKRALDAQRATLRLESDDGTQREATLDFSALPRIDPDGDFLAPLGLALHRPMLVIARVEPGSAGDAAGLRSADVIEALNGTRVSSASQFVGTVRTGIGVAMDLDVVRGSEHLRITAVPRAGTTSEAGGSKTVGRLGIALTGKLETATVRYDLTDALTNAVGRTWDMSAFSLKMLGKMLTGELSIKHLSGPVSIADYAGQSARIGLDAYIGFIALISISLGVLNLLPVPMLDGGHLLYYLAELARGKPLPERVIAAGQRIGLALLVSLMAVALFNDVTRLFT